MFARNSFANHPDLRFLKPSQIIIKISPAAKLSAGQNSGPGAIVRVYATLKPDALLDNTVGALFEIVKR